MDFFYLGTLKVLRYPVQKSPTVLKSETLKLSIKEKPKSSEKLFHLFWEPCYLDVIRVRMNAFVVVIQRS